ncbi:MAG TPA: chitobiase/beta-hexosaminidase C-terminal domain-containing protein, partial [Bryobacteraceae bacterium]|nr:chitobiase/beta-hexosaminidase C-terminal domain-containing protein [Bryobacteraceae bacterium]
MTILNKLSCALIFIATAVAQNVVTQHYDIARSGQNVSETTLTPANVNTNSFGRLFSVPVQGYVFAQPLYMSNLTIPGLGQHNVVFIATEHDSVYAFDADTNGGANATPLWQITLLDAAHGAAAGATTEPSGSVSTQDINPEIGITGTPVIDPTTGTMYLVGQTVENGIPIQRLHALDVTSGAEKFGGPVTLAGSVPGTGNGSSGGVLKFDPKWQNNRAGLLLLNGIVYVAFGSHGDNGPWHGWIFGYNAKTLAQTGVFCTTSNGIGSGVWMAGSGLAADVVDPVNSPFGRLFAATGNGSYSATIPYTNTMSYGDDLLRLDLTNGVPKVTDAFTPYNQQQLSSSDADLASGGILVLPNQTTGGHTHLLLQAGKQGTLYLVDRDNMGDFGAADNVVQEITGQIKGLWSMPAYWNNNVYVWGNGDHLKAFSLSNGLLSATPTSVGSETSQFPGSTATVSANGNTNGIVWNIQSDAYGSNGPAILLAHDATNVATTLYSSNQNATRDFPGNAVKFTVPVVINSKVYVGGQNQVSVYGLLNGAQQIAAPVIQPATETFSGSISVTMSDSTSGASIYYTTDGTLPTEASNLYTGPFSVTSTTTIRAIATLTGFLGSPVTLVTYTSQAQVAAPVFSPSPGTYTSAQAVTISDPTAGTVIYYTLDGTTPTTSSAVYSGPIQITSSSTINAIATATGQQNSPTSTANYSIQLGGTGINFGNGFSTAATSMQFNGSTGLDDSRLQLTNGGAKEAGSAFYNTPVSIQNFTNDFAFQLSNPNGDGMTFTIQGQGPTALGASGGGLGYGPASTGGSGGIPNSVAIKFDLYSNAGEGSNSTGIYLNGVIPTLPAVSLANTGINLHSGDTMQVHMTYDGTTLAMTITDAVVNKSFAVSWQVNIPSAVGASAAYVGFTGGSGSYTASQKIMTWTYVTTAPQTATPIMSPIGGTYMPPQSVTITDATPGASIFYTLDGTTPSSASKAYTGPIALSADTTVVSAIAIGAKSSSVASATYNLMDFSMSASPASLTVAAGSSGTTKISVVPVNGFNGSVALSASGLPSGVTASFSPTSTTGSSTLTLTVAANTASGKSNITVSGVAGTLTRTKTVALTIPAPQTQVTAPTFSPVGGTYTTPQSVTISDATPNSKIYYTLDGTTPTTSSAVYSAPIQVSSSLTVKAMAAAAGLTNSPVSSVTYSIQTTQTGINFGTGFSGAQSTMQFNGTTTLDSS